MVSKLIQYLIDEHNYFPKRIHIDCDNLNVYESLVGNEQELLQRDIYEQAVPTALEFFSKRSTNVTLFVVGNDLINSKYCVDVLKSAVRCGNDIGNHSQDHNSNFSSLNQHQRNQQIVKCHETIKNTVDVEPKVYRSPGYAYSVDDSKVLGSLGYLFDYSPTSRNYLMLLNLYSASQNKFKKWFPIDFINWQKTMKAQVEPTNELLPIATSRLPILNISTVWHATNMVFKNQKVNRIARRLDAPVLFHAVDFLDAWHPTSKILALKRPLIERLDFYDAIISK